MRAARAIGALGAVALAMSACGGGQSTSETAPAPAATTPPPAEASAEERHAERTETALYGLCTLATRCAVLQGEAMGDQLSDEDRAALADKRVLDANTAQCVDAQMEQSELSPRQVGVIEGCVEKYKDNLVLEQCDPLFACVNSAGKSNEAGKQDDGADE